MPTIGNITAAAGTLDAGSQLAKDIAALKNNPNDTVAQAQVNADYQNLVAAASSVVPGVGASTAAAALLTDINLIVTKYENGQTPRETLIKARFAQAATQQQPEFHHAG